LPNLLFIILIRIKVELSNKIQVNRFNTEIGNKSEFDSSKEHELEFALHIDTHTTKQHIIPIMDIPIAQYSMSSNTEFLWIKFTFVI